MLQRMPGCEMNEIQPSKKGKYEFFAVSIEHFFEDPKGMVKNIPDLYETLKILLNQDPLVLLEPYY